MKQSSTCIGGEMTLFHVLFINSETSKTTMAKAVLILKLLRNFVSFSKWS